MTPEATFLAHLPHIDKVVTSLCRRQHLRKEECEDFRSRVHIKLIDNDYAVIRKFQGRSSLKTYLTTVVTNEMKDFQNHIWGKWRPSAEAERLGPTAILLERLLVRDGYSFEEAVQILQTNYKIEMSWQEMEKIAGRLPSRSSREMEGEEVLGNLPAPGDAADDDVAREEREAVRRKVARTLPEALKILSDEDRLILKMRMNGFTVAQIARTLHLEQKQLYRRIEKILNDLRQEVERLGLRREDVKELFDD